MLTDFQKEEASLSQQSVTFWGQSDSPQQLNSVQPESRFRVISPARLLFAELQENVLASSPPVMIDNQQSLKTKIKFASHPDWKPRKHFSCCPQHHNHPLDFYTHSVLFYLARDTLKTDCDQTQKWVLLLSQGFPRSRAQQAPLLLLDPALMYHCTNSSEILCVEAQMPPTTYLCFNGLTSQGTWKPLGGKKKSLEVPLCLLRSQKSPALLPANPQTSPCALLTSLWLDIPNYPSLKLCSFENRMALQGSTAGVPLPLQVS